MSKLDLRLTVLEGADDRLGKKSLIPGAAKKSPKVVRQFVGQLSGIAGADDTLRRIMAEHKGRECDRRDDGFERPGRHVDDETPDFAVSNSFKLMGERSNMPTRHEALTRRKRIERFAPERYEILTEDSPQNLFFAVPAHPLG